MLRLGFQSARASFLSSMNLVIASVLTVMSSGAFAQADVGKLGWDALPTILARLVPPTFPNRDFVITKYGAVADNASDIKPALAKAINACNAAGGGRVVVPAGSWFIKGPIHLKSGVNLHLLEGATINFSTEPTDYEPVVFTRFEGTEIMNYSPLIYAFEQENIAITGKGTFHGRATTENWWTSPAKDRGPNIDFCRLYGKGEEGVPVRERRFGRARPGLRPVFVQPYRCQNVLIEGVTFRDSPMWFLNPVLCTNVTIRNVSTIGHGPNNDGCDPESSTDVLIEGCYFDTGDDCIAIKSGRDGDGRRVNVPTENVIVRNCTMKDGHGGVVLGSECSGSIRNVFVENCVMDSPDLDRALRFKSNAVRGGVLENVFMRNVRIGRVSEAVLTIDLLYSEGAKGDFKPIVRNVDLANITSTASPRVLFIRGIPNSVIDDIRIHNSTFQGVTDTEVVTHTGSISLSHVTIIPAKLPRGLNSMLVPLTPTNSPVQK